MHIRDKSQYVMFAFTATENYMHKFKKTTEISIGIIAPTLPIDFNSECFIKIFIFNKIKNLCIVASRRGLWYGKK